MDGWKISLISGGGNQRARGRLAEPSIMYKQTGGVWCTQTQTHA
jgi:hypothetical protein